MDMDIPDSAYFEATWQTIVTIAEKEYKLSPLDAARYAWTVHGRMMDKSYEKLEH